MAIPGAAPQRLSFPCNTTLLLASPLSSSSSASSLFWSSLLTPSRSLPHSPTPTIAAPSSRSQPTRPPLLPSSPFPVLHRSTSSTATSPAGMPFSPLEPDPSLAIPRSFSLQFDAIRPTKVPAVFKINATLYLRGGSTQSVPSDLNGQGVQRRSASFSFCGYWSRSTGHLCAVGSGTGVSQHDRVIHLHAVLKLTYPQRSDILNSLVTGVIESLAPVHSFSYFDSISLVAYSQLDYEYSMTPQALSSCSRMDGHQKEESHRLDGKGFCDVVRDNMMMYYDLMYSGRNYASNRSGSPFPEDSRFLPRSMLLNEISCSEDGRLRMFMSFLNTSNTGYLIGLVPNRTLVAEGVWDQQKGRLCLVACRVVSSGDSEEKASVDDCTVRMSLWFPAVITVKNRRSTLGRLWSGKEKGNPDRFHMIALGSKDASFTSYIPGVRYKYTETDTARKLCAARPGNGSLAERPFPDENSMGSLRFGVMLKWADSTVKRGDFDVLTLRGQFKYRTSAESPMSSELVDSSSNSSSFWEVSYSVSYVHAASEPCDVPSAEGLYEVRSGSLCMIACLPLGSSDVTTCRWEDEESMDCKVLMNLQVPPLDAREEEMFHGSISSLRERTDPFYFPPTKVSSYAV